jgi:LynF/TruF/PatF family peptide O-prenyltransferase
MNPLVEMYEFHKKEFNIEDNRLLKLFEELLSDPCCSILECSAKISNNDIHAGRLRLGYEQGEVQEGLHEVQRFLDKIAKFEDVSLRSAMLYRIVDKGFDVAKVMAVGIGFDYRENGNDSKVKCYFRIRDYPEKVDEVLSLHGPVNDIGAYLIHEEFMFGISMYLDGRTGVEIYPFFDSQELRSLGLMDKLNLRGAVTEFIDECILLHISFHSCGKRMLHFHPQSATRFVRSVGNRQLSLLYSRVQILNLLLSRSYKAGPVFVNLSLMEDEIIARNIQNINLQYALTYKA